MAKLTRNKYVGDPSLNGFRLTLTSGTPVTTADVTGATSVYLTPYRGDHVVLFDGTNYQLYQPAEMPLALGTLADASNYDIWLYPNAGVPTPELSAAWTNDTTRSEAIATTNGVTHKSGDQTRRLVGTIRTTSTTTTEDSKAKQYVSNKDNIVERPMLVQETTASWTYTTATLRAARGQTTNALNFVLCEARLVTASVQALGYNSSAAAQACDLVVGIGADSTSASSADVQGTNNNGVVTNPLVQTLSASLRSYVGVGAHTWTWLEYSTATGTTTWLGRSGSLAKQSAIYGTIWN